MDFSKLGSSNRKPEPTDPVKIFETLPSLENTPNDLWRGQGKALTEWHKIREENDILLTLNTGAGKTIVGLLIAQSLVNEGLDNVIYLCSTIDLVNQTSVEANRIGIQHTTRVKGFYNNDLFETAKSFCITTYAALFGGLSSIRRNFFPQAIVFDDAHVAESILRDSFTITIKSIKEKQLFDEISELFRPHFKELGVSGQFSNSLDLSRHSSAFVSPRGLYERSEQLLNILIKHGLKDHSDHKYAFAYLEDHINACAAIFTRGVFEISPPFLPSLALDIFEQKIRRVYLSATLQSQTEFIRAFGRKPDCVIAPENDAGNGERLIVRGRKVEGGFGPDYLKSIIRENKVVVAVPDYYKADRWRVISEPPSTEMFTEKLNTFRSKINGAFILVSRVDGIDLPDDTCRVMVIDGLPSGTSLLDKFQWEFLRMNNVHAVRIANRLVQLFGRINRGRNDYGAFLIEGDALNNWLGRDRNLALLPPLLQKQFQIGQEVQTAFEINSSIKVNELVDRVLARDPDWIEYYKREVRETQLDEEQIERAETAEPFMEEAALAEARYSRAVWGSDYSRARRELEKTIDDTAEYDTPLAGWHAVWLAAAHDLEGDAEGADRVYGIAMSRLNRSIRLPRRRNEEFVISDVPELNDFGKSLNSMLSYGRGSKFEQELGKLRSSLSMIGEGAPKRAEIGVRTLGELLGFTSIRPDNDIGTGPDVIWCDEAKPRIVGFELKTDKNDPATYFKGDISQGHDHLAWMKSNYGEYGQLGLLYVGPSGQADRKANPTDEMGICVTQILCELANEITALIDDLREQTPLERIVTISKETEQQKWDIETLVDRLWADIPSLQA